MVCLPTPELMYSYFTTGKNNLLPGLRVKALPANNAQRSLSWCSRVPPFCVWQHRHPGLGRKFILLFSAIHFVTSKPQRDCAQPRPQDDAEAQQHPRTSCRLCVSEILQQPQKSPHLLWGAAATREHSKAPASPGAYRPHLLVPAQFGRWTG